MSLKTPISRVLTFSGYLLVVAVISAADAWGAEVMQDDFAYTNFSSGRVPMNRRWESIEGMDPFAIRFEACSGELPGRLRTINSLAWTDLGKTLSKDFKVKIKMLPSAYSLQGWVGLSDGSGKQGYAFLWNSSAPDSSNGQGFVRIGKFSTSRLNANSWNVTDATMGWTPLGKGNTNSGHGADQTADAALATPMAEMEFSWDAETGTLRLWVDGRSVLTVEDRELQRFTRIYIGGGNSIYFSDLTVSASDSL
jgi:hypothetical protein